MYKPNSNIITGRAVLQEISLILNGQGIIESVMNLLQWMRK